MRLNRTDQSSPALLLSGIMFVLGCSGPELVHQPWSIWSCVLAPLLSISKPYRIYCIFSAWRWHVYDRQPHAPMPLLQAMEQACGDTEVRSIHESVRHTRQGSISPPTHNCHVLQCIFGLFLLKLNLLHCKVQFCNVQYWMFDFLVVVKTCRRCEDVPSVEHETHETWNMKDCSVLYKAGWDFDKGLG